MTGQAKETGFKVPVAVSLNLYAKYISPPKGLEGEGQSVTGRLHDLFFFHQRTPENGSTKSVPGFAVIAELEVLPDVLIGFAEVMGISGFRKELDHSFDVAADETDVEFFYFGKDILVEKSRVHADNDGNGFAVAGADHAYHMADHFLDSVAIVRVLVSATEDGINNVVPLGHLERLEALDLIVCGAA